MHPSTPLAIFALPALLPLLPARAGIEWQVSFADTLAAAGTDGKVVFVAVNMDGERANDRMAKEVYTDARIRELSEHTLNLVASTFSHAKSGRCPRFGGVSCEEHRRVDIAVREQILKPDEQGFVVAPQHAFLDSQGQVILSVPYEVTAPELEWCFVTALQTADPELRLAMSSKARAPKRLILGGVHDLDAEGGGRPRTRDEVLELIKEIKKGSLKGGELESALRQILSSDEEEAIEFIRTRFRSGGGGGARAGGGGRGGGGGGERDRGDQKTRLMRDMGVYSPASYWEIAAEYAEGGIEGLRAESVVALEQIAAPESLKVLNTGYRKEREPLIKKNFLRALGSAGAADKRARTTLIKVATKEKDPLLRSNAIVALGYLAPDEEVKETLAALLQVGEEERAEKRRQRIAAVCAMGMSRDGAWKELLEATKKEADEAEDDRLSTACAAALEVLEKGDLKPLRDPVMAVCEDVIERQRFFGLGAP